MQHGRHFGWNTQTEETTSEMEDQQKIKIHLKVKLELAWRCELNWADSRYDPKTEFCKHGDYFVDVLKGG